MNIGFVTTRLFDLPRSGGEICSARLLRELALAGHQIELIGRGPARPRRSDALREHSVGPVVPAFDAMPPSARLGAMLAALATGRASTVQRLAAGGVARHVRRLIAQTGEPPLQALWVDHLQAWPWIAGAAVQLSAPVLVMHNLESDGYAEQADAHAAAGRWLPALVLRREARLLRALELHALRQAGAVACLSEADAGRLRQLAAAGGVDVTIEVLPGFPLCGPLPQRPRSSNAQRCIGLVGTWTWGPNRSGLQWMLDQVLPQLPDHCNLLLAGTGLDAWPLPARVQSLGRIDDVAAFYDRVDVVAIPAFEGSGVQEKAIEAIGTGRTVVATHHALRGLGPDLPANVRVADAPAPFAVACSDAALHADGLPQWTTSRRDRYRQALLRCSDAAVARCRPGWPALARGSPA